MIWLVLAAVVVAIVVRFARQQRRTQVSVLRSHPISTIHGTRAKKQTARTKAALDAATDSLR